MAKRTSGWQHLSNNFQVVVSVAFLLMTSLHILFYPVANQWQAYGWSLLLIGIPAVIVRNLLLQRWPPAPSKQPRHPVRIRLAEAVWMLVSSIGVLAFINCAGDFAEPEVHTVNILHRETSGPPRSGEVQRMYIVTQSWRNPERTHRVSVSGDEFHSVPDRSTQLRMTVGTGLLGFDWVCDYALIYHTP